MTSLRFVLATHNAHKVAEFDAILSRSIPDIEVLGYDGPEPVESGATFSENALIKARAAAAHTGLPAFADDSGLCVDVMAGMPGIFSSRWSGEGATDATNVKLLLTQLTDVPDRQRMAHFRCVIAVVFPAVAGLPEREFTVSGSWPGRIAREPLGANGFGYDPVFIPEGETRSAAQMDPTEKNDVSHRAVAIRELAIAIRRL